MEELKAYFYSLDEAGRIAYATACKTTVGYLKKAFSTKPQFDGALCLLLDENSGGVVRKASLRPDIWPELAQAA